MYFSIYVHMTGVKSSANEASKLRLWYGWSSQEAESLNFLKKFLLEYWFLDVLCKKAKVGCSLPEIFFWFGRLTMAYPIYQEIIYFIKSFMVSSNSSKISLIYLLDSLELKFLIEISLKRTSNFPYLLVMIRNSQKSSQKDLNIYKLPPIDWILEKLL